MPVKTKRLFILAVVLLAVIAGIAVFASFKQKKNLSYPDKAVSGAGISANLDLELGQNMIVGIPGPTLTESIKNILHKIKPGGIVLYRRNYQSDGQFKSLIQELQAIAQEDSGVPYFIMLDEEPDGASRLDLLTNVFTLNLPDWRAIDGGISKLENLGVTVDLAPVTDYPFNEDSFIKKRVPTDNLSDLKAFNQTFIGLLKKHNILATLKHFPGAGVFVEDPHKVIPNGYVNEDYFNQSLSLFKSGIDAGAQFVMTNHAIYENIDPVSPATLSYPILTGLLRKKIDFKGIIITDDIEDMLAPVWKIDPADAGVRALEAGNTMIMYGQSLDPNMDTFTKIKQRVESDKELKSIVEQNYIKIISLKNNKSLAGY